MNSNALEFERIFHGTGPTSVQQTRKEHFSSEIVQSFSSLRLFFKMFYWKFSGNFVESSVEWKQQSTHTHTHRPLFSSLSLRASTWKKVQTFRDANREKKGMKSCSAAFFSFMQPTPTGIRCCNFLSKFQQCFIHFGPQMSFRFECILLPGCES